jgi:hypothetical protein
MMITDVDYKREDEFRTAGNGSGRISKRNPPQAMNTSLLFIRVADGIAQYPYQPQHPAQTFPQSAHPPFPTTSSKLTRDGAVQ